ncbi:MAG: putative toxin-antitoxin system toxin component, PIN family [Candidatus Latescibacteria bacterium]|nr:putative toxin-antitoxin system toxin component, PIN family [Candidatus Latescibacterota bacterium]
MKRIVLDTNVIISAILNAHGSPGQILNQVLEGKLSLCLSTAMVGEIRRVIRYEKMAAFFKRVEKTIEEVDEIIDKIVLLAEITPGDKQVDLIDADPDDNMVLACTLETRVDYIVSGDSHLTNLGNFEGVPILTPRNLLGVL